MCKNQIIIAKNKNGSLSKCIDYQLIYFTYNNIHFEFTYEEFDSFKEFILNIELNDTSTILYPKHNNRNITVKTYQNNLFLIFKASEILDIKQLVFNNEKLKHKHLQSFEIDYKFELN